MCISRLTLLLDVINIERTLSNRILSVKLRFKKYYKEPMFVIYAGLSAQRVYIEETTIN